MSNAEIVRAWKDPEYRSTLKQVPSLPVGSIELEDPYYNEDSMNLAGRRGEHTSVMNCHTHDCSSECATHSHCPLTGWQCRGMDLTTGTDALQS